MNGNAELLNYIYQNSKMGIESIEKLMDVVKDKDCLEHLQTQLSEYQEISNKARMMLIESGSEEKDLKTMAKISSSIMIKMKTMTDNSASHIAEMMIQGSTMGVIESTKNIKKYADADKSILDLAHKLLKTEESNIMQWKKLL